MNEVFEKARELGEALLRSDEYARMQQIEDMAMKDENAAKLMGMYLETRNKLTEVMRQEEPDMTEAGKLSVEMESYQEKMNEIDAVKELTRAREQFSDLVNQVNQVLRFILTGEMGSGEGDCSGNCASCGGGCRTLN